MASSLSINMRHTSASCSKNCGTEWKSRAFRRRSCFYRKLSTCRRVTRIGSSVTSRRCKGWESELRASGRTTLKLIVFQFFERIRCGAIHAQSN